MQRLSKLIQNLLNVAKIENKILKLKKEVFDIDKLIEEIAEEFKKKRKDKY